MDDPNLKDRRIPGLDVTKTVSSPSSSLNVDTAVPAFIGYTERADMAGEPARNVPVRIASLMEYQRHFGRGILEVMQRSVPPAPMFTFEPVQPSPLPANTVSTQSTAEGAGNGNRR